MFRPLRRKQKAIPREAAVQLLQTERRGVLAVNGDDGYPYAIPVNFYYDAGAGELGKIWFHGAKAGHKVDALKRSDKVCFTVYGNEQKDPEAEWAPILQSTVVFGRCRLVMDAAETEKRIRTLAEKYYPSAEAIDAEIAKDLRGAQLYELTIEQLCGKQIQER